MECTYPACLSLILLSRTLDRSSRTVTFAKESISASEMEASRSGDFEVKVGREYYVVISVSKVLP